jgi:hypothetical protein
VEHRWVNFLLLDDLLLGSRGSGSLLSLRSGLRAKREASGCHIASKAKHDEKCRTLVAASLATSSALMRFFHALWSSEGEAAIVHKARVQCAPLRLALKHRARVWVGSLALVLISHSWEPAWWICLGFKWNACVSCNALHAALYIPRGGVDYGRDLVDGKVEHRLLECCPSSSRSSCPSTTH